jgi:hypothetical protein
MKTAGEFRAEAEHLRDVARSVDAPDLLEAIQELIEELEAHARESENGA